MSISIPSIQNILKQILTHQLIIGIITGFSVTIISIYAGIIIPELIEDRAELTYKDFKITSLNYGNYDKNISIYDKVTIKTIVNITNKEDARYIAETTTAVYWITMTNGENTHPRSFYSSKSKIPIPPGVTFTRTDDVILTGMKNGEYVLNCVIEYEDSKGALHPLKMSQEFAI